MSYIIFGGLFDPPHLGHLEITRSAISLVKPDKFIWVPAKYPPHRKVEGISAEKRVSMLKWWFQNRPEFSVSEIELNKNHSGFSIETINKFNEMYPGQKSYFLIGSDESEKFCSWIGWKEILEATTLIIARRKEKTEIPAEIINSAVLLNNKICEISSSLVRKNLKEGISVKGMVDNDILEYIEENRQYK